MDNWDWFTPVAIQAVGTMLIAIRYRSSLREFWVETKETRTKVTAVVVVLWVVVGPWIGMLFMWRATQKTNVAFLGVDRALQGSLDSMRERMDELMTESIRLHQLTVVTLELQGDQIDELEEQIGRLLD